MCAGPMYFILKVVGALSVKDVKSGWKYIFLTTKCHHLVNKYHYVNALEVVQFFILSIRRPLDV